MSDEELCEAAHQFTPIDQRHTPDTCPACLLHARVKELGEAAKNLFMVAIGVSGISDDRVSEIERMLWPDGDLHE